MSPRRRMSAAAALAVAFPLAAGPAARAATDALANVSPASPVPAGLAERYPLGHYALDSHFDAVEASLTGGVDASGVPPMIAHFLANTLWQLTALLAEVLITLFAFAFSLDLVRGSRATGGAGALEPVGQAIRGLYADVLGQPWLAVALTIAGLWAIWRALVQRRYTDTAGALGLSLLFVVLALAFVTQPERTVGQAVRWTNQMSLAFLSLSSERSLFGSEGAKRAAADQLFSLLVYEPWVVLQFGGREHCVRDGTGTGDDDPESVPVRPLAPDPAADAALASRLAAGTQVRAAGKTCLNDRNKYAPHFLRFAPASDERDAEYEALNDGDASKLPDADPSKRRGDYPLGAADEPAADAMEMGGQYQRLLLATVVFCGELGAFLLLGALTVGVTLAQVLLLLLLAFAPVALVAGAIPGRGHDFFRGWLTRLAGFLLRKAAYSLILAVLLAVNAALAEATSNLGWLLSFGLQALLFWAVFLYRRQLTGQLLAATTGSGQAAGAGRLATLYYGGQLAARPVRAAGRHARRSLHARGGGPDRPPKPPDSTPPAPTPQAAGLTPPADASGRPAVAGRADRSEAVGQTLTAGEGPDERAGVQATAGVRTATRPLDSREGDRPSAPSRQREPAPPEDVGADRGRGENAAGRPRPPEGEEHARPQAQEPERSTAPTRRPSEGRPPAAVDEQAPSPGRSRPDESPLASELRGDRLRLEGERGKGAASEPDDARGGRPAGGEP
jgi:hypothetical protein